MSRTTDAFRLYSQIVWPAQRLVTSGLSKRCDLCAASVNHPDVWLGHHGDVCGLCDNFMHTIPLFDGDNDQLTEFDELMEPYQGNWARSTWAGEHDIVFMFSGGKDSAYLLHWMRTRHPYISILCVMVDNGFLPSVAVENARRITSMLDADFLLIQNQNRFKYAFRNAFADAVGLEKGCYGLVDFADGELIHKIGYELAQSIGCEHVISGISQMQAKKIFNTQHFECCFHPGVKTLLPYVFLSMSEQDIMDECVRLKLMDKKSVSPLSTNSSLITLMAVVDICTIGYSSFEPEFCQMIREGKADYKTWYNTFTLIEHCGKTGFLVKDEVREVCEKLELQPKCLNIEWLS